MIAVSDTYREAVQLHRTRGFRNQMHAEVSLGLFADGAKADSTYSISGELPFSDAENMYSDDGSIINRSYVTFEKDGGFPLNSDVSHAFVPTGGRAYLRQGYTSKAISNEDGTFAADQYIDITFGKEYSAVGLTFNFESKVGGLPKEILVTAYNGDDIVGSYTLTDIADWDYKPEIPLDNFTRLRIEFVQMEPYQRVRLNGLQFGIGYIYSGENLISISHNRSNHPLSLALPQTSLDFTVYNDDNRFDIDSDSSVVRFLHVGQMVRLKYGYDLDGYGNVEWFDAGTFYVDSWTTTGYQATFQTTDIINRMSKTTFKKGIFNRSFYNIKNLATQVADDFGLGDYDFNEWRVQTTSTQIALPYASHAECLQLLANCATATIAFTPDGGIRFRQGYLTDSSSWNYTLLPSSRDDTPQLPFSDLTTLPNEGNTEYALFEQDFFRLDGSHRLIPSDGGYLPSGYVSNVFPNSDNVYTYPGLDYLIGIQTDFTAERQVCSATINTGGSSDIIKLRVSIYNTDAVEVYQNDFSVPDPVFEWEYPVQNAIWFRVLPLGSNKYQRQRVVGMKFQRAGGLNLLDDDVLGNKSGELMPEVKNVLSQHHGVWYYNTSYSVELMRVNILPGQLTEIKHSDVYYNVTVGSDTAGVVFDVAEHYAYASFIQISGVTAETEIIFYGAPYSRTDERYETRMLSTNGVDAIIANEIQKNQHSASYVADWAASYYADRNQYQIEVPGYPECEPGDYITFNGNSAVVLENNITLSGGAMRGKMKLRKGT